MHVARSGSFRWVGVVGARKLFVAALLATTAGGCGGVTAKKLGRVVDDDAGTATPGYPSGAIATLSGDANDVLIFSPDPSVVSPAWHITTPALHLYDESCEALAFDREDRLYVLCKPFSRTSMLGHIFVFASGATGDVAPLRTVSVPRGASLDTLLMGFAVDDSARLVLLMGEFAEVDGGTACGSSGAISILPKGVDDVAAPIAEITGDRTELFCPISVSVDAAGRIYVSNEGIAVTVYGVGITGNAAPERSITNPRPNFGPIAADRSGNVFVAAWNDHAILEYAFDEPGITAKRELSGPSTGIYVPDALAADQAGRVYVASLGRLDDASIGQVAVFAPGASGNVPPERVLSDNVYGQSVAVAP